MLSGMSGLVYSAALKYLSGATPPARLTAAEAQPIFFMSADDIDVAESQKADSPYKWSQPGFDQRFGYGRVNADAAVAAVKDWQDPARPSTSRRRPGSRSSTRIRSPGRSTSSARSRPSAPPPTTTWPPSGRPACSRSTASSASSSSRRTSPGDTVFGGDGAPLASLDIRSVDPKHVQDIDSPNGENDTTITVRVRAARPLRRDDRRRARRDAAHLLRALRPDAREGLPHLHRATAARAARRWRTSTATACASSSTRRAAGSCTSTSSAPDGPQEMAGFPFLTDYVDGLADTPPTPTTPDYLKAPAYAERRRQARPGARGAQRRTGDCRPRRRRQGRDRRVHVGRNDLRDRRRREDPLGVAEASAGGALVPARHRGCRRRLRAWTRRPGSPVARSPRRCSPTSTRTASSTSFRRPSTATSTPSTPTARRWPAGRSRSTTRASSRPSRSTTES